MFKQKTKAVIQNGHRKPFNDIQGTAKAAYEFQSYKSYKYLWGIVIHQIPYGGFLKYGYPQIIPFWLGFSMK